MFEITFESVGAGTCMVIDFKDGALKSFGDKTYCEEWQPDVKYDPVFTALTTPQPLTHTF